MIHGHLEGVPQTYLPTYGGLLTIVINHLLNGMIQAWYTIQFLPKQFFHNPKNQHKPSEKAQVVICCLGTRKPHSDMRKKKRATRLFLVEYVRYIYMYI